MLERLRPVFLLLFRTFLGQLSGCSFYLFTGKLNYGVCRRGLKVRNFMKKVCGLILAVLFSVSLARAQSAEVMIQLNEPFFDALLDSIFKNADPPEYPLAFLGEREKGSKGDGEIFSIFNAGFYNKIANQTSNIANCRETIKLQRQMDGVKTTVRFRNGQITAPIAFSGNYNPPFIGCVDFSGVADASIELEFDQERQVLIGRARVSNVNMSGTGGIGSGMLARMVQNSIDKKVNPIQILAMDKVSFVVPIQNGGNVRMKAVGIRHEVGNGFLNVYVAYEFQ